MTVSIFIAYIIFNSISESSQSSDDESYSSSSENEDEDGDSPGFNSDAEMSNVVANTSTLARESRKELSAAGAVASTPAIQKKGSFHSIYVNIIY